MSTPSRNQPANNVQPPRCPYCSEPLPEVSAYNWHMPTSAGLGVMLAIYCPHAECRKIIGTQILIIPHAQEKSSIVGPH